MDLQNIINNFNIKCDVRILLEKWNESHRAYHNLSHLQSLISQILEDFSIGNLEEHQKNKLIVAALFHKIVFDPSSQLNEENSVIFFEKLCVEKHDIDIVEIKQIILDSKSQIGSTPLSNKFIEYDLNVLKSDFDTLMQWENNLREEYSMYTDENYKMERMNFLEKMIDRYPQNMDNILDLMNTIKHKY